MRNYLLIIFLFFTWVYLRGQGISEPAEGTVSYVTPQNVYVKFQSTATMAAGDTLFIKQSGKLIPALVVRELSSTSCVCNPIAPIQLKVQDKVLSTSQRKAKQEPKPEEIIPPPVVTPPIQKPDSIAPSLPAAKIPQQSIHGYFAIASFSNFSNTPAPNTEKLQYTFSLNAHRIGNTGLSVESYMTFYQKTDSAGWSEIQKDVFNGLKIYNLSVSYEFNKTYSILLGRKINPKISNMGAVDGLQFEMRFKPITVGILAGSRPDYENYSFNPNLVQFGGYLYNEVAVKNGLIQSTLAFVQQNNSGNTDRRFIYLQHSNSFVKNLNFFGTVEFDLYNKVKVQADTANPQDTLKQKNSPRLSNLYLSLRWRIIRQLSLSISYSNRTNIVYYETYKNFIDKLLEFETTQGYLLQVNYRPVKRLSIGVTTGYRFQQKDPKPSANVNAYVTYSDIPGIGISATASFVYLQTSYLSGGIYGIGISRDFFKGKLYAGLNYKYVGYKYGSFEMDLAQNVGEASLTWRIYKRISFSVYYEGTFQSKDQFNRIYGQLNLGF
jgi:hypothetical protein